MHTEDVTGSVGPHQDQDIPVYAFFGIGNQMQNGTVSKIRIDHSGFGRFILKFFSFFDVKLTA